MTRAEAGARPLWMPGTAAPAHLKGTLPGDYGFDPLDLGTCDDEDEDDEDADGAMGDRSLRLWAIES